MYLAVNHDMSLLHWAETYEEAKALILADESQCNDADSLEDYWDILELKSRFVPRLDKKVVLRDVPLDEIEMP